MTGATGHLYLYPKSRVVLFDAGARRRGSCASARMAPRSRPRRTSCWCGAASTSTSGRSRGRVVRGEALDERLVRRTYLNDAGVLAYRHYELFTRRLRPTSASRWRRARRSTTAR